MWKVAQVILVGCHTITEHTIHQPWFLCHRYFVGQISTIHKNSNHRVCSSIDKSESHTIRQTFVMHAKNVIRRWIEKKKRKKRRHKLLHTQKKKQMVWKARCESNSTFELEMKTIVLSLANVKYSNRNIACNTSPVHFVCRSYSVEHRKPYFYSIFFSYSNSFKMPFHGCKNWNDLLTHVAQNEKGTANAVLIQATFRAFTSSSHLM